MSTSYRYNRRPRHNRKSWRICKRALFYKVRGKWVEMNPTLEKLADPVVHLHMAMAKLCHALDDL